MQNYYREHINAGLFGLLAFMGLDSAEVEADGWLVRSADGREFIDCVGGYGAYNFGHRHPKIIAAVAAQLKQMPMSSKLLLNPVQAELAKRLAEVSPGNLTNTFFCNSGTEAVEAALKLARLVTGKPGIISAQNAFHGKTLGSLSSTHRVAFQQPFMPLLSGFSHVEFGSIDSLASSIDDTTAAIMLEPIQGEGGIVVPPAGYLTAVRELATQRGVLLIMDEVQTGMGRTGYNFACDDEGIAPDILVLAKSLGGGVMPIGATIGTKAVWKLFEEQPLVHTSTFGGSQLACSAALAALDVLYEDGLAQKAKDTGTVFLAGLKKLAVEFPKLIAEARGQGLMLGIEMVSGDASELFIASVLEQKVLIAFALNQPGVIRLEPPLTMTVEVVYTVLERLRLALIATQGIFDQYELSPSEGASSD